MDIVAAKRNTSSIPFLPIVIIVVFWVLLLFIPVSGDWHYNFRPAAQALVQGQNPYRATPGVYNPFWSLIPILFPSILPEKLGFAILGTFHLIFYITYLRYLRIGFPYSILLITTPQVLRGIIAPNLDWLVLLGILSPPQIGLFLVLAKPQLGFPIALYWLIDAWKIGGIRRVIRTFSPVSCALAISVILYGPWMFSASRILDVPMNMSAWPYSIPLGLFLVYLSIKRKNIYLGTTAGVLLSPYVGPQSVPVAAIGLWPSKRLFVGMVVLMWLLFFLTGYPPFTP